MKTKYEQKVSKAVEVVQNAIKRDSRYRAAWQCSLSMAFRDRLTAKGYRLPDMNQLADEAANNFIEMFITRAK